MSPRFVARAVETAIIRTAASAAQHVALIGPPGTGKSALIRAVHPGAFTRLLTRHTTPDDVFGPISLQALDRDEYVRAVNGYLPTAEYAFLDEWDKASGAILQAFLTILNEREFDNGPHRLRCPLVSACVAANAVPDVDQDASGAVWDRVLFRHTVQSLPVDQLRVMLSGGGDEVPPMTPADLTSARAAASAVPADAVAGLVDALIQMRRPESDRRVVWARDAIPHAVACAGSHVGHVVAAAWLPPDAPTDQRNAVINATTKRFAPDAAQTDKVRRILELSGPKLDVPAERENAIRTLALAAEKLGYAPAAAAIADKLNVTLTRAETARLDSTTRRWLDARAAWLDARAAWLDARAAGGETL